MSSTVPNCIVSGHGSWLVAFIYRMGGIMELLVVGSGFRLPREHSGMWARPIPIIGIRLRFVMPRRVSINWTYLRVRGIDKSFGHPPFGSLFHMHSPSYIQVDDIKAQHVPSRLGHPPIDISSTSPSSIFFYS
jgi:hypothetical protein